MGIISRFNLSDPKVLKDMGQMVKCPFCGNGDGNILSSHRASISYEFSLKSYCPSCGIGSVALIDEFELESNDGLEMLKCKIKSSFLRDQVMLES